MLTRYFIVIDIGDPSFVCSPQSTIIAIVIVVAFLNFGLVAGFVFFYRMKKKHWVKVKEADNPRSEVPPPLPPHHPRGGSGAIYSNGGQEVLFKSAYDPPPRAARFTGNPTLAGMSKQQGH